MKKIVIFTSLFFLITSICYAATPNGVFYNSPIYLNRQLENGYGGDTTVKEFVEVGLNKGSWSKGVSENNWVYHIKDMVNTRSSGTSISFVRINNASGKSCVYVERIVSNGQEITGNDFQRLFANIYLKLPTAVKNLDIKKAAYEKQEAINRKQQQERDATEQKKMTEVRRKEEQQAEIANAKERKETERKRKEKEEIDNKRREIANANELREAEEKRKEEEDKYNKRKQMIYSNINGKYERLNTYKKEAKSIRLGDVTVNLINNDDAELSISAKGGSGKLCSTGKVIGKFNYDEMQVIYNSNDCKFIFNIIERDDKITEGRLATEGKCLCKEFCSSYTSFIGTYTRY